MRGLIAIVTIAGCSSSPQGAPPSDPDDVIGSWQDVLPDFISMTQPSPTPVDQPHAHLTLGTDGSYERIGSDGSIVTGTYTADAFDLTIQTSAEVTIVPYSAVPGALMLEVGMVPDQLESDGVTGTWAGDEGDLDLSSDGSVTGDAPGLGAVIANSYGQGASWQVVGGNLLVWTQPGNLVTFVDFEVLPGRALGGTLYAPM
ncbi:MAG TPA: hypothetical protein VGL61_29150 [Kofleriaceae bacterium]|jgi:hypothetical protein